MNIPSFIKLSAPTKEQLKHDVYLVIVAFLGTFFASWQAQPNPLSKAGVVAGYTAAVAALVTVVKSVLTTL